MNNDKKLDPNSAASPAPEAEDSGSRIGPYHPALGEIYQRLYPEIKRPKPNPEAIAAALQAMQRLTMKVDAETAVEATAEQSTLPSTACHSCGHRNREGNRFCAMCGLPVESAPPPVANLAPARESIEMAAKTKEISARSDDSSSGSQTLSTQTLQAEIHGRATMNSGAHFYHHHYHHHYFPGGAETSAPSTRPPALDSAREADRLRMAAAAKGEPLSRSEAAVRRLTQEWVLACNTRQLDELLELYAPDALVLRSNLPPLRGAAQVREFFFSALESGLGEVALETIRIEVVGDLAHEVGRYSALVPGTTGKRREERGKYLWVFAKQDNGDWKLVSECWSSDLTLTNAESDAPKAGILSLGKGISRKS